jgi:hypothetical protein
MKVQPLSSPAPLLRRSFTISLRDIESQIKHKQQLSVIGVNRVIVFVISGTSIVDLNQPDVLSFINKIPA